VPERDDKPKSGLGAGLESYAEYSVVAFVFPVAVAIGFFGGRWIGSLLGGPMVGGMVGVLFGTAAGFYHLWQTLQRIERRDRQSSGAGDGEDDGGRPG